MYDIVKCMFGSFLPFLQSVCQSVIKIERMKLLMLSETICNILTPVCTLLLSVDLVWEIKEEFSDKCNWIKM